jgi:hypothetical protein
MSAAAVRRPHYLRLGRRQNTFFLQINSLLDDSSLGRLSFRAPLQIESAVITPRMVQSTGHVLMHGFFENTFAHARLQMSMIVVLLDLN